MKFPLDVLFLHLEPTPSLEAFVRTKAAKLVRFKDCIIHCRMVIDAPHHHRTKGNGFRVSVETLVPGQELVITHQARSGGHEDLYAAIGTAINRADAQLRTYLEKRIVHHNARARRYRHHLRRIDLQRESEFDAGCAGDERDAGFI